MSSLVDIPPEIDWARINDPPESLDVGEGGGHARVAFVIPWSYRYNFYDLVAGTDETFPLTGGGSITRKVPLRHPDRPNVFLAIACHIEGWGSYEGEIDTFGHDVMYSHARCVVDFETPSFGAVGDQPFAQIRTKKGQEYITKPGTAFVFSDGSKSEQAGGIFVSTCAITLTTFLNPTLDHVSMNAHLNRLNVSPIFGYPAGTVRYLGADTDEAVSAMGVRTHVKAMQFLYREIHHNFAMRHDGELEAPLNSFTGLPTYASSELNDLLI